MRRVTGAVVLMGVAASAVTGCVTVRGEVEPRPSEAAGFSERESVRRDEGGARPRMGRPPAREALSRPRPRSSEAAKPEAPARDAGSVAPPAGPAAPPPAVEDGAADGEGAPPTGAERQAPAPRSPGVSGLPGGPGVCDLGRRYGGWADGSVPEEVCERAYGG